MLGITEEDVKSCYDKNTLLSWRNDVVSAIMSANIQLKSAKGKQKTNIKYFKKVQGVFQQLIDAQLSKINSRGNELELWKSLLKENFPQVYKIIEEEVKLKTKQS